MKVFLNICTSPEVKEYDMQHVKGGLHVSLPHSVSPVREDIDKGNETFSSQKMKQMFYDDFHEDHHEGGVFAWSLDYVN